MSIIRDIDDVNKRRNRQISVKLCLPNYEKYLSES